MSAVRRTKKAKQGFWGKSAALFMKIGVTRFVAAVIIAATLVFAGVLIYNKFVDPLETSLAVSMTVRRETPAQAYVIRDEYVFDGDPDLTVAEKTDRTRVAAKTVIATVYSYGDKDLVSTLREYKRKLAALQSAQAQSESERLKKGGEAVTNLLRSLALRDIAAAGDYGIEAESLLFYPESEIALEIEAVTENIGYMTAALAGGREIETLTPGIVSYETDGFEHIRYSGGMTLGSGLDVTQMTPSGLRSAFASPLQYGAAKMCYGSTWYIAAILSLEDAATARDLGTCKIYAGETGTVFTTKFERICREENGEAVVIFSSTTNLTESFNLRSFTAYLILEEKSGYAVPKEAVKTESDGATYVYIAVLEQAEKVRVDVLYVVDERTYLVAPYTYPVPAGATDEEKQAIYNKQTKYDQSDGVYLRDGAEIIRRATGLEDGKKIR